MTCSSCVRKIETSIGKLRGIESAEVALLTHCGRFKYDPSLIGPRDIIHELDVRIYDSLPLLNYKQNFSFSFIVTRFSSFISKRRFEIN